MDRGTLWAIIFWAGVGAAYLYFHTPHETSNPEPTVQIPNQFHAAANASAGVAPSTPRVPSTSQRPPSVTRSTPAPSLSVTWNIDAAPGDKVYTSVAHLPTQLVHGSPSFAHVTISSTTDVDATVTVTFDGYATTFQRTTRVKAGAWFSTDVPVDATWNGDKVRPLTAPTPFQVALKVSDSTGRSFADSKTLEIEPVMAYSWDLDPGGSKNLVPAFITPGAPFIRDVLAEAAHRTPWGDIRGYMDVSGYSRHDVVAYQMKAVWDSLQTRGFTYVNAPEAYGSGSQSIKSPQTTYADRTGNCIESTLLLASVFEVIGFHTDIILIPHHAFLGVEAWSDNGTTYALETTMLQRDTYNAAAARGNQEFDPHQSGFHMVRVANERPTVKTNPWL